MIYSNKIHKTLTSANDFGWDFLHHGCWHGFRRHLSREFGLGSQLHW